jgi:SAM-dependent methyltransferase
LSFSLPDEAPGVGRGPFELQACAECGTWQVNPHPGLAVIRRFFEDPRRWAPALDPNSRPVDPLRRAEERLGEYRRYAAALKAQLPERGLILDVGAGTGLMLSLLDGVPNPRLAVEPNPAAAAEAARRGLQVSGQWAEELRPPFGALAALIMNQSLDHLVRPDLFLGRALHWLAPGGLVLLSGLINPRSLAARVYGPSHRLFHPFHQVYPPPTAVRRLLAPWGLELTAVWKPYFGTPYGSWRQLLSASAAMTVRLLRPGAAGPSPAFPGSCAAYLARKTLLTRSLTFPDPNPTCSRRPVET